MNIEVNTPITAEAEVKKYLLVGDDIYIMQYDSASLPQWYKDLIENALSTSGTISNLQELIDLLNGLSDGYSISISNLSNSQQSMYTELEALSASLGQAQAAIVNLDLVKVTATDATAISQNVVGSYFSTSAGAWFDSKISTYASNIEANASSISSLSAVLGNQQVSLDSIDSVLLNTTGWAANSSKLITAPDGSVTGWSFADGSNVKSTFKIMANNFSISNGTTGYTPFSISGGYIYLNGKVDFTNVNNVPTINKTYSQTSAPTSGMLIGDIWIDTDDSNKVYTYTSSGWTPPPSGSKTYAQTSAPTSGMVAGDLWYDTDNNNLVYRYNGSSWVNVLTDPATYINANTTTINGGKITTGSITAGQIATNTITASQIATGAITADKISAGTITANKISAGNLGNSLSVSGGSPITAQLAVGSSLTYANTNNILSCIYSNPLPVAVKLLIIVAGRSGLFNTSGTQAWGIFIDSTKYYDNTWTPMSEDAKAMTTTYTIPANNAVTISTRAARSDSGGTTHTQISISVLGILS